MSIACFAAVLSAATSVALGGPQAKSSGDVAAQPARTAPYESLCPEREFPSALDVDLEVVREPLPVRFETGAQPGLKFHPIDYGAAKPAKASPALTATKKPKSGIRTYGAITNISENVQAIVEYYDEMTWRPISMDDGAGVEYHVKFGAKEGR